MNEISFQLKFDIYQVYSRAKKVTVSNCGFLVAAATLHLFKYQMATSFAFTGSIQLATGFAIEIYKSYQEREMIDLQIKFIKFEKQYPKVRFSLFMITLATAQAWIWLSCIFGALLGMYCALIAKPDYYRAKHLNPF